MDTFSHHPWLKSVYLLLESGSKPWCPTKHKAALYIWGVTSETPITGDSSVPNRARVGRHFCVWGHLRDKILDLKSLQLCLTHASRHHWHRVALGISNLSLQGLLQILNLKLILDMSLSSLRKNFLSSG